MLSAPELVLFVIIVLVTLFFHKWPRISDSIARARLRFDKGVAEEYIEVLADDGDVSDEEETSEES